MALVGLPGSKRIVIGPNLPIISGFFVANGPSLDALNEAAIINGHIETSDGGSHTIDTTGSSSIFWLTGATTFANAGTTVKVGLAAVDTATGPPGRAVNVGDVITFDVSKTLVGGGGGITSFDAQNHVPDTGSKTIANGDLVAFCIQMTARAGSDTVTPTCAAVSPGEFLPFMTSYTGGAYAARNQAPNVFITFSDGATGWFIGSDVFTTQNSRLWNSSSATKEYGQLYSLPFPIKVYGFQVYVASTANFDCVLYSDPLASPVAERTTSIDANTGIAASGRRLTVMFASPFTTTANQLIAAVLKPTTGSDISFAYKTISSAAQRISDPYGTSGYGISRASGAFANANSSLDHYYIGLIAGAFEAGGTSGRVARINDISLVA